MVDADELFNQALKARELGNAALATDRLVRVLGIRPGDVEARLVLAELHRERGRVKEAEALLVEGVSQKLPIDVALPMWLALADLRLEVGDAAGAARACHHVLKDKPAHAETLYILGNAFLDVGANAEAAKAYAKALETDPFDAETWHNHAVALERCGLKGEAAAAIEMWHRLSATQELGSPPDFSQLRLDDDDDGAE